MLVQCPKPLIFSPRSSWLPCAMRMQPPNQPRPWSSKNPWGVSSWGQKEDISYITCWYINKCTCTAMRANERMCEIMVSNMLYLKDKRRTTYGTCWYVIHHWGHKRRTLYTILFWYIYSALRAIKEDIIYCIMLIY